MCGLFGVYNHKEALKLTYLGLYSLQHRGQESAGLVVSDGKNVNHIVGMGLAGDVLTMDKLCKLSGNIAIGHVRYSTTGSSLIKNAQPFLIKHNRYFLAIAHNGNLVNTIDLRYKLESSGAIFQTTTDSELVVHLIARSKKEKIEDRIIESLKQLKGAYSFLLMTEDKIIAVRDPYGFRPLALGKIGDSYVVASETCAFDISGAKYVREIEPGEMVVISKKGIRSINVFKSPRKAFCIFEYIYFARPDSNIFGQNVCLTRERLGRELARECPANADMVMPIPDSGNYAALGFAKESQIPFKMGIVRNHYIGRTFIQPLQEMRDMSVKLKLNPVKDVIKGKRLVVIEDSIVRGTTSKTRIKALREAGAKEIHMRVSCPPLRHPCFYGIDFHTKKELIAAQNSVEKIAKIIGVDSLGYLSVEGMLKAMFQPKDKFCTACFSGNYPEIIKGKVSKYNLE
ncbi:MAG: amidophosphoribosyltransferase [Elusimicrobia bacterium]|nr:amidophosphoribosyltransferase [Candidatus Liberimonas magnetica]